MDDLILFQSTCLETTGIVTSGNGGEKDKNHMTTSINS